MLLTVEHECVRVERRFPRADRLRKIQRSMAAIRVVIAERNHAVRAALELVRWEGEEGEGEEVRRGR